MELIKIHLISNIILTLNIKNAWKMLIWSLLYMNQQYWQSDYNSILMNKVSTLFIGILLVLVSVAKSGNLHQVAYLSSTQAPNSKSEVVPSLDFYNRNGSCFGQTQLSTLISLLNKASMIYREDFEKNLRYIQENMDAAFGTQNERYNIFIQGETLESNGQYHVYPIGENGCNFVSLFTNINLINPDWSYLVVKNYYDYTPTFIYTQDVSQGAGITPALKTKIQKFIADVQRRLFTCLCTGLTTIATNLKAEDGQDWSVVCQTYKYMHGYFAPKNDQWIFSQRECSYILYVQ